MRILNKWLLAFYSTIFIFDHGYGQMALKITLPSEEYGTIKILRVIEEGSVQTILTENFEGQEIKVLISLRNSILKNNPVIKYIIAGNKKTYESTFAGEKGLLLINLEPKISTYSKKSKFYYLTQMINNFRGDASERNLIIKEIARLYKKFPKSIYVQYVIYHAFENKLITLGDLNTVFNLKRKNSYWISKL